MNKEMAIYTQLSTTESKKQNKLAEQKQNQKENFDSCQMGEVLGGMGEKSEGITKYKLVVTEQSWDVKYTIGTIVNNILLTRYGVRWV